jgi:hypothetical protein
MGFTKKAIIAELVLIGGILSVGIGIWITLDHLYDSIRYDYRPTVQCVNNNQFECPVEKGAVIIINETTRGETWQEPE